MSKVTICDRCGSRDGPMMDHVYLQLVWGDDEGQLKETLQTLRWGDMCKTCLDALSMSLVRLLEGDKTYGELKKSLEKKEPPPTPPPETAEKPLDGLGNSLRRQRVVSIPRASAANSISIPSVTMSEEEDELVDMEDILEGSDL